MSACVSIAGDPNLSRLMVVIVATREEATHTHTKNDQYQPNGTTTTIPKMTRDDVDDDRQSEIIRCCVLCGRFVWPPAAVSAV